MSRYRVWGSFCSRRAAATVIYISIVVSISLPGQSKQAVGQTPRRPNIVLILADDMGSGDVQALNPSSKIATPNLNRLAADGMTFTDGHSPSAVCTPTRYGLLTGRYCWRTRLKRGVLGGYSKPLLETGRSTIANMLKTSGYTTGAVGKWHLGMALPLTADDADTNKWDGDPGIDFSGTITDSPVHHGFDSYFGVTGSLDMAPYVYVRNDRFTMEPSIQQPAVSFPHFVRKGPRAADFVIADVLDKLTSEAVGYIADASKKEAPYFLYMPLTGPHKPAQPHERFRGKTGLKEYGDFVAQVDWTVGQVLKAIDATNEVDNTIVFYTSDNGSYMYRYDDGQKRDHVDDVTVQGFRSENHRANGMFRGTKADVWEAGHRVPFFVRWPGHIKPGTTNKAAVCLTDIYATCAAIVGANVSENEAEDSISLLPMLQGKTADRGAPIINHSIGGMFAIRDGQWKLIAGNGSGGRQAPKGKPFQKPYQLFNLRMDPGEANNVAAEHPEVVIRMTEALEVIRTGDRTPKPRR
ncbi:MAG: arylsulfatase [Fuerstiella sp.]